MPEEAGGKDSSAIAAPCAPGLVGRRAGLWLGHAQQRGGDGGGETFIFSYFHIWFWRKKSKVTRKINRGHPDLTTGLTNLHKPPRSARKRGRIDISGVDTPARTTAGCWMDERM